MMWPSNSRKQRERDLSNVVRYKRKQGTAGTSFQQRSLFLWFNIGFGLKRKETWITKQCQSACGCSTSDLSFMLHSLLQGGQMCTLLLWEISPLSRRQKTEVFCSSENSIFSGFIILRFQQPKGETAESLGHHHSCRVAHVSILVCLIFFIMSFFFFLNPHELAYIKISIMKSPILIHPKLFLLKLFLVRKLGTPVWPAKISKSTMNTRLLRVAMPYHSLSPYH